MGRKESNQTNKTKKTNDITKKKEIIGPEHHTLPNMKSNMNGSSPRFPLHHSSWLGNASHVLLYILEHEATL